MTIATDLGFVVGNRYKVITAADCDTIYGEILTFTEDDGTPAPFFKNTTGREFYMSLEDLEPYEEPLLEVLPATDSSVEALIISRDEAKEVLVKAQKALEEKLSLLSLPETIKSSDKNEPESWEKISSWKELSLNDTVKVEYPAGEYLYGKVDSLEYSDYTGDCPVKIKPWGWVVELESNPVFYRKIQ